MCPFVSIHPHSFLRDRVILPIQGCAILPQKIPSKGIPQRISSQNGTAKTFWDRGSGCCPNPRIFDSTKVDTRPLQGVCVPGICSRTRIRICGQLIFPYGRKPKCERRGCCNFRCSGPFWQLIFLLAISPGHQLPLSAFAPCKPPGPSVFLVCLPDTAAIFRGAEGAMKGNTLRKRFFLILRS